MSHDTASFDADTAARWFDEFGLELSEDARKWAERLADLRDNRPQPPAHNAVAVLIANAAKTSEVDRAIATHVGQQHRVQQFAQAENIVGARLLAAILADRDRLHAALKPTAVELIDRLHAAAAIRDNVTELTRAKRLDDAELVVNAPADAESLRQLFYARDAYLTPAGAKWSTGWWSCGQFENPWDAKHVAPVDSTQWGSWQASIRSGARLWYPSWEQATEASAKHEPVSDVLPPMNPVSRPGAIVVR